MDGGRRGNTAKFLAPWKEGTGKDKKKDDESDGDDHDECGDDEDDSVPGFTNSILGLVYTEESIQARRQKLRSGTGSVPQWEWAHVLANARLGIPERSRKNYPGTTAGDTICGMTLPELSTEWYSRLYG